MTLPHLPRPPRIGRTNDVRHFDLPLVDGSLCRAPDRNIQFPGPSTSLGPAVNSRGISRELFIRDIAAFVFVGAFFAAVLLLLVLFTSVFECLD